MMQDILPDICVDGGEDDDDVCDGDGDGAGDCGCIKPTLPK